MRNRLGCGDALRGLDELYDELERVGGNWRDVGVQEHIDQSLRFDRVELLLSDVRREHALDFTIHLSLEFKLV